MEKHDAHANLFFCQSKPIAFFLFVVAIAKTPYCCDPQNLATVVTFYWV